MTPMTPHQILNKIEQLAPNNQFLPYIVGRIEDDNYRGIQCSQHNRLSYSYFKSLIQIIYNAAGAERFDIHIGDDKGTKQPEAAVYYDIVDSIKAAVGKGTINSVKKNTFPDLARAGFLYRFDKHGEKISELFAVGEDKTGQKRDSVRAVQLSPLGVSFATAKTEFEKMKYYTDMVDVLTKSAASELVELLSTDDRFDTISLLEFMYILSDDREAIRYNDKLLYLTEYRKLTISQQKELDRLLKMYCNPNLPRWNKTAARDYRNWKNESQQIFGLLSNSTYFKVVDEKLLLNNDQFGLFVQSPKRKQKPKDAYFKYHQIHKQAGYELHHIIPFNRAQTQADAQWIDDERNLIYLSTAKHAEFTATQNSNVRTSYAQPILSFLQLDTIDKIIHVDIDNEDAIVAKDNINAMVEYNKRLLEKFYPTPT